MLETFTVATFAPHLGEAFRFCTTGQAVLTLTLSEVTPLGPAPAAEAETPRRAPFAILFHGPPAPVLPQRTYHVEHAALGDFALFLVPLGPDRAGQRYEAVFG